MIPIKRKSYELDILLAGHAMVDKSWRSKTANSQYSRLFFVKEGSFFITSQGGERTVLRPGYAYLIPVGYPYSYGTDEGADHFYFHIRLAGFGSIDALSRFKTPHAIPFEVDFSALGEALRLDTLTAMITIDGVIYSAISALAKDKKGVLDGPAYSEAVARSMEYISSHLSLGLTLSEISDAAYTSQSTLTARFRREVGMSIGEYIDYLVMLKATDELVTTERNISEISDSLGFCDQFYFSRRFKEKHGLSPREFRKNSKIG